MEPHIRSLGRRYPDSQDVPLCNPFLDDFVRILNSKAFRRMSDKTQVIFSPEDPHVRTRLKHTLEVIAQSTVISEKLGLNTSLCQAVAAEHDIGHPPYGHEGEEVLSELGGKPLINDIFGIVIAQHIERQGKGLNLSYETLNAMNHSRKSGQLIPDGKKIQEYSVVMYSDKISYVFSDINDAIRYGSLKNVPDAAARLGRNQRERTFRVISSLVEESEAKGFVSFSEGDVYESFNELKRFMTENVYLKKDKTMQQDILRKLHSFLSQIEDVDPVISVALMTDSEANHFGNLLLHGKRPNLDDVSHFGIFEILPHLKGKLIDYSSPDMDWKPV
jgi:dGTPase